MSRSRGRGRRPQHLGNVTSNGEGRVIRGQVIDLGDMQVDEGEPVIASFRYFGAVIRVNPMLSEIDVMDFFEQADKVAANDPKTMIILKEYARKHVHPADWDTFWTLVREHHQDSNAIMTLLWKILEGVSARPTGQPSGSSDGLTDTKPYSPPTSSAPDVTHDRREAFLRQIQRFEAQGTGNGAAMAAQIVILAESQGIDLEGELVREPVQLGSLTA